MGRSMPELWPASGRGSSFRRMQRHFAVYPLPFRMMPRMSTSAACGSNG